jgi:hypothetical protein
MFFAGLPILSVFRPSREYSRLGLVFHPYDLVHSYVMSLDDSSTLLNTLKPQLSKAAVLFNWILSDSNFLLVHLSWWMTVKMALQHSSFEWLEKLDSNIKIQEIKWPYNPAIFFSFCLYRNTEQRLDLHASSDEICRVVGHDWDGVKIVGYRSEKLEVEEMDKVLESGSKLIFKSQL